MTSTQDQGPGGETPGGGRSAADGAGGHSGWPPFGGFGNPFTQFYGIPFSGMAAWPGPAADMFEQWRKAAAAQSGPARDALEQITAAGNGYLKIADALYKASMGEDDVDEKLLHDWLEATRAYFEQWKNAVESGMHVGMARPLSPQQAVMRLWRGFGDALAGGSPWDWDASGLSEVFPQIGQARAQFDSVLAMPGLGLGRERQEKAQRLAGLLMVYGEALKAWKLAYAKNNIAATEVMKKRLAELEKPIESLRELYDFWVAANEDVYTEFVRSDAYRTLYGNLVNSQMAAQKAFGEMAEDAYKMMGLTTRRDMDAVVKKLQHAYRENRQLKKQHAALAERLERLERPAGAAREAAQKARAETRKVTRKKTAKKAPAKPTAAAQDLTRIKGIGPKLRERLHRLGITRLEQIAALDRPAIAALEKALKSDGRVAREQWVRQAKALLGKKSP